MWPEGPWQRRVFSYITFSCSGRARAVIVGRPLLLPLFPKPIDKQRKEERGGIVKYNLGRARPTLLALRALVTLLPKLDILHAFLLCPRKVCHTRHPSDPGVPQELRGGWDRSLITEEETDRGGPWGAPLFY